MDALTQPGVRASIEDLLGLGRWVRGQRATALQRRRPAGSTSIHRRGQGFDLLDIRPWSTGDEVRTIDRNASARRGELQARQFRDEREQRHTLVVDLRPSMLFGTRRAFRSVVALECASLLGWTWIGQGQRLDAVALVPTGPIAIRGGTGRSGMEALTAGLVRNQDDALRYHGEEPALDRLLAQAAASGMLHGALTLISACDNPGRALPATLRQIGAGHRLRLVQVQDAVEVALPPGQYTYSVEGETPRQAIIERARPGERLQAPAQEVVPDAIVRSDDDPPTILTKLMVPDRERVR